MSAGRRMAKETVNFLGTVLEVWATEEGRVNMLAKRDGAEMAVAVGPLEASEAAGALEELAEALRDVASMAFALEADR